MPSRSSPSCEQPNGWAKAWTPSTALGVAGVGDGGDLLGGAGDAADRRQDPDLVARADAAVGAAIAVEARVARPAAAGSPALRGVVAIGARRRSSRVARLWTVDMRAGRDRLRSSVPIGQPYLRTVVAGGEIAQRDLVALRDRPRATVSDVAGRDFSPGASGRSATATSSRGSSRSRLGGAGRWREARLATFGNRCQIPRGRSRARLGRWPRCESSYAADGRRRRLEQVDRKPENGNRRAGKPTINDVARLAGVSKKTVSRVINRSPLLNDETTRAGLEGDRASSATCPIRRRGRWRFGPTS